MKSPNACIVDSAYVYGVNTESIPAHKKEYNHIPQNLNTITRRREKCHTRRDRLVILYTVLQSFREGLVVSGELGSNAEVDGTVTDVDDETTDEVGVDLMIGVSVSLVDFEGCMKSGSALSRNITIGRWDWTYRGDNLELLALAVLRLGDGLLETGDRLAVEFL